MMEFGRDIRKVTHLRWSKSLLLVCTYLTYFDATNWFPQKTVNLSTVYTTELTENIVHEVKEN